MPRTAVFDGAEVRIEPLAEHERHVDAVARWMWDEWRALSRVTLEETRVQLLGPPDRPAALLALTATGDSPLGALAFRRVQYKGREPLELWINALYVREDARGHGIGTALVVEAIQRATIVADVIYVYTHLRGWYESRGFSWVEEDPGTPNGVLCRKLG